MNDIPVTIVVGTWILAAWCGFWLAFAALHGVLPSDSITVAVAIAGAILAVVVVRRILAPLGHSARLRAFVILSAITFVTLVVPLPLPFLS